MSGEDDVLRQLAEANPDLDEAMADLWAQADRLDEQAAAEAAHLYEGDAELVDDDGDTAYLSLVVPQDEAYLAWNAYTHVLDHDCAAGWEELRRFTERMLELVGWEMFGDE